ncbi:MAG: helix-turn-helix domain-containing protein [Chloroflexota bacterium]
MARHKEFDQGLALEKAMTLFWQKGYAATSIQDLVEHMGIGRRSLYDTFNSKHDLFLAALDRYRARVGELTPVSEKALTSPMAVIKTMFEQRVQASLADEERNGCFAVNSAIELSGQDEAVTTRSEETCQEMILMFQTLLQQAQQAGELRSEQDVEALAQYLANAMFGIRVMSKMKPDKQTLMNVVNLTLSVLN